MISFVKHADCFKFQLEKSAYKVYKTGKSK